MGVEDGRDEDDGHQKRDSREQDQDEEDDVQDHLQVREDRLGKVGDDDVALPLLPPFGVELADIGEDPFLVLEALRIDGYGRDAILRSIEFPFRKVY